MSSLDVRRQALRGDSKVKVNFWRATVPAGRRMITDGVGSSRKVHFPTSSWREKLGMGSAVGVG